MKSTRLLDTSSDSDRVQHEIWAGMSESERSGRALAMSRMLLESSRCMIDQQNEGASVQERIVLYVAAQYGADLAEKVRRKLVTLGTLNE